MTEVILVNLVSLAFELVNYLLTAIMEGSITPGHDAFNSFLINNIAVLSSISEEEKAILKIYVRLAYGGSEPTLNVPFPFAKKHNLFFADVSFLETIARSEYETRRRSLIEKSETDTKEYINRLIENGKGTEWELPPLKEKLEGLIQWQKTLHDKFISKIDNDESYGRKWRTELAPTPFSVRIDQVDIDKVIRGCVKELEGSGQRALQTIQDFVGLCTLLADPENCIKVKSGQYTEREVNARTELDMIGERARELMALPKYTVYVKKLDSAHATGIYKTTTRKVPGATMDMRVLDAILNDARRFVWRSRRDIQEEIYNRQMPVIEDSEPPSPYD